jgi:hypothetical protein
MTVDNLSNTCAGSCVNPQVAEACVDNLGTTDSTEATEFHEVLSAKLQDEVLCLMGETSEKFVPAPTKDQVISDAVEALRQFKEAVRWKAFFRSKKLEALQQQRQQLNLPTIHSLGSQDSGNDSFPNDDSPTGLGTGLRIKTTGSNAPRADDTVELFLRRVEEEILDMAFSYSHHAAQTARSPKI